MEFIKSNTKINFVGYRNIAIIASSILMLVSLFGTLVWPGINWGIDFAGGAAFQVSFQQPVDMNKLRGAMEDLDLGEVIVQKTDLMGKQAGDNYLIKVEKFTSADIAKALAPTENKPPPEAPAPKTGDTAPDPAPGNTASPAPGNTAASPEPGNTAAPEAGNTAAPAPGNTAAPDPGNTAAAPAAGDTGGAPPAPPEKHELNVVEKKLADTFGPDSYTVLSMDFVGPRVGAELRNNGIMAVALSLVLLLAYVTIRFEFRFAIGAIIALAHDVLITLGFIVFFHHDFNLTTIAVLLTIVGYSVNDTIVICDRIRENTRKLKRMSFSEMINQSINETLSRTILTSLTVMVVVFSLYVLGGSVIKDFAFAMLPGLVSGVYSTVYIATPIVIYWENYREAKRSPVAAEAKK